MRTGRPPLPAEYAKIHRQEIRLTDADADKLEYCSRELELNKTDVLIKGLNMIYDALEQ